MYQNVPEILFLFLGWIFWDLILGLDINAFHCIDGSAF